MSKRRVDPFVPPSPLDETEREINELITRGRDKGFLTYQELNTDAPEEAPCPAMMDRILQSLDLAQIRVIDGDPRDPRRRREGNVPPPTPNIEVPPLENEASQSDGASGSGTATESALDLPITTEKIDDPVRMYLTQMGEIPLLTRDEEISLSKKIEITRKRYRHQVLENGIGVAAAIRILQEVARGDLAFDRTLRIGTADPVEQGRSPEADAGQPPDAREAHHRHARRHGALRPPGQGGQAPPRGDREVAHREERLHPEPAQPPAEGAPPPRGGGDPDQEDPPRARGVRRGGTGESGISGVGYAI